MERRRRNDRPRRLFTIDLANATLPLVRAILRDIVSVARELDERHRRVAPLLEAQPAEANDPYSEEILDVRQQLESDQRRLKALTAELAELGVRLSDPLVGEVEFPARIGDRRGWLSWRLDESEVDHWRPKRTSARRRLPMAATADDGPTDFGAAGGASS